MIGFEVTVNGKTYFTGVEEGVSTVILSGVNNIFQLHIGGLNSKTGQHTNQYSSEILPGMEITVRVKDIVRSSPSVPRLDERTAAWRKRKYFALKEKLIRPDSYRPLGLEMSYRGKTTAATLKSGANVITITHSRHGLRVNFGGFDNSTFEYITWFCTDLEQDDEIRMRVKEVLRNSPSIECQPHKTAEGCPPPLTDAELLEKQRQELLHDGIIGPEE